MELKTSKWTTAVLIRAVWKGAKWGFLKEHLLPHFAWDRGSLSVRICYLEESDWGWMCSIFLAYCHVAFCTDCIALASVAWAAGPRLCLWYRKFCAWKSHPQNTQWSERTSKQSCHLFPHGLCLPLSSPRILSCTELLSLIQFIFLHASSTKRNPLRLYIVLLIFLGCFYSFFFIISMVSLFPSVSFSVLSLTFFSFPFFHSPVPLHSHLLASQVTSQKVEGVGVTPGITPCLFNLGANCSFPLRKTSELDFKKWIVTKTTLALRKLFQGMLVFAEVCGLWPLRFLVSSSIFVHSYCFSCLSHGVFFICSVSPRSRTVPKSDVRVFHITISSGPKFYAFWVELLHGLKAIEWILENC